MSLPLISTIIPTYNSAQTLPKCLGCIFNQTYKNLEIIVVNDGSTDNTREVLERYIRRQAGSPGPVLGRARSLTHGQAGFLDPTLGRARSSDRAHGAESEDSAQPVVKDSAQPLMGSDGSLDPLHSVRSRDLTYPLLAKARAFANPVRVIHQKNQGAPAARNRGFRESKGEYLLFVDSDVYLKLESVQKMYQTLQRYQKAAYAYCSFKWGWKKFKLWEFDSEKLKQMPYIHTCSLIRREAFPIQGWDESLKRFQDWDLWLTMLENGHKGVWIPEILFTASTKGNTMSTWIPSFVYNYLPWLAKKRVEEYDKAKGVVLRKHRERRE